MGGGRDGGGVEFRGGERIKGKECVGERACESK